MHTRRRPAPAPRDPSAHARRPATGVIAAAMVVTTVLAVFGGRYGFHRDELYFIEAGLHPAWGYPDQPSAVPLLAAAWHGLVGGSLWAFRLLPAVAAGALVVVGGATSAELGGSRREQTVTAALLGLDTLVIVTGHLFSTTTFDLLMTATVIWLLMRALTAPPGREVQRWLLVGIAAGVALHVKLLPATVLVACAAALALVGPRQPLRRPGPWLAAAVAVAIIAPHLAWQAVNGWPQIELSSAIAAGSSGTSVDRWLVLPMQIVQHGPPVAAVALTGIVVLLRRGDARAHHWIAVAYLLLLGIVLVTGGKPYYTAGLFPALLAAGTPTVVRWVVDSRRRRQLAVTVLAVQLAVTAVIALPVVPPANLADTPVTAINYDAGETIGWDRLVETVVAAHERGAGGVDGQTIVLTANYGEAGALDRARRRGTDLPPVYSGHNGYGLWGPPPPEATSVVLVGDVSNDTVQLFAACDIVGHVDNGLGVDNEEQGAPVRRCSRPTMPWPRLWPRLVHLD